LRLVIDANIAQSAGTSDVPVSLYSRECLNAIRDSDHVAVFCEKLLMEWSEHASLVSRRWWKSMTARRRIERREGIEFAHLLDRSCAGLERESWKNALRKDFHLVQSALASDQTILSNERGFPTLVAIACARVRELTALYFANPALEQEVCIHWIKAGAEKDAERRIDVWAKRQGGG
jgi:hypothetical protein